ncbi:MAG: polysaccharide pyruvyl transferase CsaB [Cyanobacteria bacterium SIG30]|nr:polysaccharide pyruvyl transferase CsaB [Cyanobacteria bacterium SIG30]
MNKKNKKVLISGYIGFGNFGDEAIFSCLVSYLKSKNVDISALSNTPDKTAKKYSINAYKYNSILEIFKAILKSDILFSGGGSLLQNNTSNKSLIYYLGIIFLAKLFGKKVVIFAQGLEGINGKFMSGLTYSILKKCDFVTVRDKKSKSIMDKNGIKAELVCDPVFSVKLPPHTPRNQIGIQLRGTNAMHPLFVERLTDAIGKYFPDKSIKVFSFQEEQDRKICIEFAMMLQRKFQDIEVEILLDSSVQEIIKNFANLEYLFAMRYHACIIGAMYGIKTMPIAYDEKVVTFAKENEMPYIDCGWEKDLIQDCRNIEHAKYKVTNKFQWNIFDKYIC